MKSLAALTALAVWLVSVRAQAQAQEWQQCKHTIVDLAVVQH